MLQRLLQKPWELQVDGPMSSSYTETTADWLDTANDNSTVKLFSGPKPMKTATLRGYSFNTSYVVVASDQVCHCLPS